MSTAKLPRKLTPKQKEQFDKLLKELELDYPAYPLNDKRFAIPPTTQYEGGN